MNRRGFLGAMAAALVLRKLDVFKQPEPIKYLHSSYALGFEISQEMIDDDEIYNPRYIKKLREHAYNYRTDSNAWLIDVHNARMEWVPEKGLMFTGN